MQWDEAYTTFDSNFSYIWVFKNKRGNVNKIGRFPAYVLNRTLWEPLCEHSDFHLHSDHTDTGTPNRTVHITAPSHGPVTGGLPVFPFYSWLPALQTLTPSPPFSNLPLAWLPTQFLPCPMLFYDYADFLIVRNFRMQKYNAYFFFGKILILGCPEAQKENTSQSFLHFRVYFLQTAPIIQYVLSDGFLSTFNNISKF